MLSYVKIKNCSPGAILRQPKNSAFCPCHCTDWGVFLEGGFRGVFHMNQLGPFWGILVRYAMPKLKVFLTLRKCHQQLCFSFFSHFFCIILHYRITA